MSSNHEHWCPECSSEITREETSTLPATINGNSFPLLSRSDSPVVVHVDRYPTFGEALGVCAAVALVDWLFNSSRRR